MYARLRSFIGIGNTHLPKWETLITQSKVLLNLILKISLLLPGIATMINFCWPIGITTTVDTFLHSPPYSFNTVQASSMRFAGVIGALSGTSCFSYKLKQEFFRLTSTYAGYLFGLFFNEWIYKNYQHRENAHQNIERTQSENDSEPFDSMASSSSWCPEYRLHGIWFPICSLAAGLLTYGLTLNFGKHWIGLAFGWIMVNLGMIATTV